MSDKRYVFSLVYVYDRALIGDWVNLDDVWISPSPTLAPNTGYFGGGLPGPVSRMDKVTYATDTTAFTPSANLNSNRSRPAASSARANALPQPTYSTPAPNNV